MRRFRSRADSRRSAREHGARRRRGKTDHQDAQGGHPDFQPGRRPTAATASQPMKHAVIFPGQGVGCAPATRFDDRTSYCVCTVSHVLFAVRAVVTVSGSPVMEGREHRNRRSQGEEQTVRRGRGAAEDRAARSTHPRQMVGGRSPGGQCVGAGVGVIRDGGGGERVQRRSHGWSIDPKRTQRAHRSRRGTDRKPQAGSNRIEGKGEVINRGVLVASAPPPAPTAISLQRRMFTPECPGSVIRIEARDPGARPAWSLPSSPRQVQLFPPAGSPADCDPSCPPTLRGPAVEHLRSTPRRRRHLHPFVPASQRQNPVAVDVSPSLPAAPLLHPLPRPLASCKTIHDDSVDDDETARAWPGIPSVHLTFTVSRVATTPSPPLPPLFLPAHHPIVKPP
ncbi:hypothetical protein Purlil1_9306 [Purpureocillium lilacinum]|uniref:Uncharacterized protein n=1 Tax=Purpureocillium lilacinum TaxID=33203 RepID=A0ABR0BR48_PURLI|nr:hypothetical protein Purlil1_9306 [Purpureocillium lilacinum]